MKDIAIYGAGGLGREIIWIIDQINELKPTWNLVGFFDDTKIIGDKIAGNNPVLGGLKELNEWKDELAVVLAFGNPNSVWLVRSKINNSLLSFPNIIHPNLRCPDINSLLIGKGNIITGNCVFSCDVSIGNFNLFNGSVCLGHDVKIGSYNTLMPAVRISGNVEIGERNLFGLCSIVLQQLNIGEGITLTPGSVLLHKPKNNSIYIGNPAKLFRY
ncbi:serine O-acetyltransferase [Bacteroidia bacterium]|nr:serine O-acetyltransferase [Bacteroidia bacterium]